MRIIDHTKNLIEVENVSFSYENQNVIENITLAVHRGDYLGLIGPNGGGKTTLMKVMLGLLEPQHGSVKIFGENIKNFRDWKKLGYVPQHAVRFDAKFPVTVEEVVEMGLYGKKGFFHNLNNEDKKKVNEVLESVEMQDYKLKLIGDLSGGQQQRVFIARALVSSPEILFLDEPTAGVDVKTQEKFYALLQSLNEKYNLTLILVSHDIEVISKEVTEFASINQKLVYYGAPEEFIEKTNVERSYGKNLRFIHKHN